MNDVFTTYKLTSINQSTDICFFCLFILDFTKWIKSLDNNFTSLWRTKRIIPASMSISRMNHERKRKNNSSARCVQLCSFLTRRRNHLLLHRLELFRSKGTCSAARKWQDLIRNEHFQLCEKLLRWNPRENDEVYFKKWMQKKRCDSNRKWKEKKEATTANMKAKEEKKTWENSFAKLLRQAGNDECSYVERFLVQEKIVKNLVNLMGCNGTIKGENLEWRKKLTNISSHKFHHIHQLLVYSLQHQNLCFRELGGKKFFWWFLYERIFIKKLLRI